MYCLLFGIIAGGDLCTFKCVHSYKAQESVNLTVHQNGSFFLLFEQKCCSPVVYSRWGSSNIE